MTAAFRRPERATTTSGCTACGSPDTATVDGVCGRRCVACPPTFQPEHAVALAVTRGTATALAYVRTSLP